MRLLVSLEDEVGQGYWGRLCTSNLRCEGRLAQHAGINVASKSESEVSLAFREWVLCELRMDRESWVRRHSLVPARRLVGRWGSGTQGSPTPNFDAPRLFAASMRTRKGARLCRACVASDMDVFGFPYWRRAHQLRGVTWCVEHRRPLSRSDDPFALDKSPITALGGVVDISEHDVVAALASEPLQRYAAILLRFLADARHPISLEWAAQVVRHEAAAQGVDSRGGFDARYLSYCASVIPESWIQAHVPSRVAAIYDFSDWINGTAKCKMGAAKTESYALALALLWERTDDALRSFLGLAIGSSSSHEARPARTAGQGSFLAVA